MKTKFLVLSILVLGVIHSAQSITANKTVLDVSRISSIGESSTTTGLTSRPNISDLAAIQSGDLGFAIGWNLSYALAEVRRNQNCSISIGIIQKVESDVMDESIKHVDFVVDEWLAGARSEDVLEIETIFYTRPNNKASWNENPFEHTKIEPGQHLILSSCPGNFHRLAVSEESYFSDIRNVITFDALGVEKASDESILEMIQSERNRIFLGFIVKELSIVNPSIETEKRLNVLVGLIDDPNVPRNAWGNLLASLDSYLRGYNRSSRRRRDEIYSKLISFAGGRDDYKAQQAIVILIRSVEAEEINLAQLSDSEILSHVSHNYKRLLNSKASVILMNSNPIARRKFEKLISRYAAVERLK